MEGLSCLSNQSGSNPCRVEGPEFRLWFCVGPVHSECTLHAEKDLSRSGQHSGTDWHHLGCSQGTLFNSPCHGLAHWPSFSLPGIDFLTPGTLWEPDFYHPIKTAALHYFSSCLPRIRPHDELKHLNSWPDFKCACHDHLPLKLRTCLSGKSPVHP